MSTFVPISHARANDLGQETAKILRDKQYRTAAGRTVLLEKQLETFLACTKSYPPDYKLSTVPVGAWKTYFDVVNETTLAAAGKLTDPVVLNFASGVNPGGGFLRGSQAQEEHIARSSTLYACLQDQPMYAFHRRLGNAMCTNYAIYSPTAVIRGEDHGLLEKPWACAVITCAAPNLGTIRWQNPELLEEIPQVFEQRIAKVLTIAALHGHKDIVLGAWGCGVYANDPGMVAQKFADALRGPFDGVFERVVFAVLDQSAAQHVITPFAHRFVGMPG